MVRVDGFAPTMHRFWDPLISEIFAAAQPRRIVEVGSAEGEHTARVLAYCAARGAQLDIVDPVPTQQLLDKIAPFEGHFTLHRSLSLDALRAIEAPDAALIDGDHNWYTVINELRLIRARCDAAGRPFPLVLLHDVCWPYGRRDLYYDPEQIPEAFRQPYKRAGIVPGQSTLVEGKGLNRRYANAIEEGTPRNGVLTAVEDFMSESGLGLRLDILPVMAGLGLLYTPEWRASLPEIDALLTRLTTEDGLHALMRRVEQDRISVLLRYEEQRFGAQYLREKLTKAEARAAQLNACAQQLAETGHRLEELERGHRKLRLERANAALAAALARREALARHVRGGVLLFEQAAGGYIRVLTSSRWRVGNRLVRAAELLLRQPERAGSAKALRETMRRYEAWKRAYQADEAAQTPKSVTGTYNASATQEETEHNLRRKRETLSAIESETEAMRRALRELNRLFQDGNAQFDQLLRSYRWRAGALVVGTLGKFSPRPKASAHVAQLEAVHAARRSWWRVCEGMAKPGARPGSRDLIERPPARTPLAIDRGTVRITQFTPSNPRNPYYTMLGGQLQRWGWRYDYCTDREALLERVRSGEYAAELVHFHQLDPLYHDRGGDLAKTAQAGAELISYLDALAAAGARILYTAHNPIPHGTPYGEVDGRVQAAMYRVARRVIVLGQAARLEIAGAADASKVVVVPHPSYVEHYGAGVPRAEGRARLGMEGDRFVFGNLGELKPYKHIELLLDAFELLLVDWPADRPRPLLLLAGKPGPAGYVAQLEARRGDDVAVHAQEIPDRDIPLWLGAMDMAVFAFRHVWVSGSALLALSYGVPAIAPDVGSLGEYVIEEDTGFLYPAGDAAALAACMRRAADSPLAGHLRYMCGVFNQKYSVERVSGALEAVYAAVAVEGGRS